MKLLPKRERSLVALFHKQIRWIAFERRESYFAFPKKIRKPNRRSHADVIARVTQAFTKRNIRSHIAACAAGKKGDGFFHNSSHPERSRRSCGVVEGRWISCYLSFGCVPRYRSSLRSHCPDDLSGGCGELNFFKHQKPILNNPHVQTLLQSHAPQHGRQNRVLDR